MSNQLLKRMDSLEQLLKQKQQLQQPKQFRIGIFKAQQTPEFVGVVDINGTPLKGTHFDVTMCEKFLPVLDRNYTYVSMRGGRGSGKSETTAMLLLLMAHAKPLKVLCFREVQNSIRDSVYQNLLDRIKAMGLESFYTFTKDEIRGANGSSFIFKGLNDLSAGNIKSFAGIDICWGEEAAVLTEKSLLVFLPTIRKEGSRVLYTWNPSLDTDAVYKRYVLTKEPDIVDIEVSYQHNPWFPTKSERDRLSDLRSLDPDTYKNIWEGAVLPAQSGAVYFREVVATQEQQRVTRVAVDPRMPVHQVWDLGWRDHTAIILVQRSLSDMRIVGYLEGNRHTYAEWTRDLHDWARQNNIANWGKVFMPHDARQGNMQTGQSPEELMRSMQWDVHITENIPIENGIRSAKQLFQNVWFDANSTERLLECLKRYSYKERADGTYGPPVHDEYSHGADAFRYLAVNQDLITSTNESEGWGKKLVYPTSSLFKR